MGSEALIHLLLTRPVVEAEPRGLVLSALTRAVSRASWTKKRINKLARDSLGLSWTLSDSLGLSGPLKQDPTGHTH